MNEAVPKRRVSVDLVQDTRTLLDLREEWDELLQDSAADSIFLTWE